ncbi:methyltransferase domain-containing protein [Bacillus salipaludis]|uniref:Methyltransferase domain-containing protein n=1 Tax=Bacillus salipaludis TaxID=2547811 RepID=A0A4R5W0P5_9BACI|nr:methyltransferase domain-containing protein [Bacillus salipaludis]MDQ6596377.1 methyltransferase domain-containing protein [Bacillus salipaludis]TDK65142.1 methyltransferase domain-containing protein [Bacillus salipaludis]
MNNGWNRFIYKCWSPIYDRFFNSGLFLKARKEIFKDISLEKGSKVLFVGVGTGADIPFFWGKGYDITAIDYSADMLKVAKEKFPDSSVTFLEMDAQKMDFPDDSFNFVVASLILSVVPHPEESLNEIIRVLKKNGTFLIFDKFAPKTKKITLKQILLRPVVKLLGTDIGLDFYEVHKIFENQYKLIQDKNVMMNGMYRKIIGVKKGKGN